MNYSLFKQAAYSISLFTLLLILVPRAGHSGDVHFWFIWASYILEHGLGNVYQMLDDTYNPLFHYVLWLFGKIAGSVPNIDHYRHQIKCLVLVFDFAGAFWAASLVPDRNRRFGLALLLLLNIGYLYNTLIWEQVDAIYTMFAFGAVVLAVQQRAVGSMMCYVLALAAKTQAIMFLPPLLLLWIPLWWQRPVRLVQASVASALLATLILAPFIWWSWENYLPRIIAFNLEVTEVFPRLSMSAYNLWYLVAPDPLPPTVSDALPFAGLTYHIWGLLLFCLSSALALFPLLVMLVSRVRARRQPLLPPAGPAPAAEMALVLLSCGLIPLSFGFFNTQMHERYWHAAVLFMAAYGFVRRDYWVYILVSIAYFLNLEGVLHFLELSDYDILIFTPTFVARLFGLALFVGMVKLYRAMPWREYWRLIRYGNSDALVAGVGSR